MRSYLFLQKRGGVISFLLLMIFALVTYASNNSRLSNSADIFLQSGTLQKALASQSWEEAVIKAIPNDTNVARDPRVMLLSGHAFYGLGQNNAAAAIFTAISDSVSLSEWEKWTSRLSTKNANSPVARYLYGDALARNEKFDQALKELTQAVKRDEKFCLAFNARGAIYDIQGNLDSAFVNFEHVKKTCPNFADVYANIGVNYLQRSIFEAAMKHFTNAIKLDPTHALAYNGRACYHAIIGKIDTAKTDIIKADSCLNGNPYIAINAKALTNPSDTTSVLGKIANLDKSAKLLRGASLEFNMPKQQYEMQFKLREMQFKLQATLSKIHFQMDLRKGVYFDLEENKNIVIGDTESKLNFATEFTIGYPRRRK